MNRRQFLAFAAVLAAAAVAMVLLPPAATTRADDDFANFATQLDSPARNAFAATPDDGADLAKTSRGLLLSDDADVRVTTAGNDTITLPLVKGYNPIAVKRVWETGTDVGIDVFVLY